jgi:hypothetical protein
MLRPNLLSDPTERLHILVIPLTDFNETDTRKFCSYWCYCTSTEFDTTTEVTLRPILTVIYIYKV